MPMIRRLLLVAGLLLGGLAGALPARAGSPFIVKNWGTEEGLPDGEVISMAQTHDGYLWLATLHGLVRFDGNQFTLFNENKMPGLKSDRIVYLFQDSHTNLWVGTDAGGAARVNAAGNIQNFSIGAGGQEGRLVSACEDSSGAVWLYTADAHLARYRNETLDVLNLNFPAQALFCRMIAMEKSGQLWIGEDRAMVPLQVASFHPAMVAVGQEFSTVKLDFILASRTGGTWRFHDGLIQKWNATQPEKNPVIYPWGNAPVKAACEDQAGNLIVGTLGDGVFWFDADGKFQHIAKDEGLSSPSVLSLCLDREGNLWVGTDGDGLNRVKKKIFDAPEIHSWAALSLSADASGGLWTAFNASGLSYLRTNATHDFGIGLGSNAWSVLVDNQQRVWAGTSSEGLFQFQSGYYFRPVTGPALRPWVYALLQDHAGQIWAGTQNGLARWDETNWKIFTTRDGLSGNTIRAIAEDADGDLWIGTEAGGLNLLKAGKFTVVPQAENGPSGNDISCLFIDRENVLWVGTRSHGLSRFGQGQWTHYSMTNGLASDSISYIIEDNQTNDASALWIGSNMGLMRILKKDFAGGIAKAVSCRTYGSTDGLPARECSIGAQPAAIRTPDGQCWFPTVKGVASVNPAALKPNLQPPLVVIESVLVDGQEQKTNRFSSAWGRAITIPPGGEELEIHYTGLNFSAPELVRFKCWLENHEARPAEVGGERVARYPKLPPGNYHFHVSACNEDGYWSDPNAVVLTVTVQPQFWQTTGFRTAVIIFLLGIVVASVRFISTQKLKRQLRALHQKELLEHERARIARDLHDQLGANLTQVTLLGEMAEADKDLPAEVEMHAQQICATARETTRSLDEIVWAVNPSNDTLEGLMNYACKYAQDYFALVGVRHRVDVPAQLPAAAIPPDVRHHVFLAFKEAVNNVVKHAQASETWVRLRLEPGQFVLSVEDNGRGLGDQSEKKLRNGLKNMRRRMQDIRGDFSIAPGVGGGTIVKLTVPISKSSS